MAEDSKIEWCDHTFNPWVGCTKVSPGCANCYAEAHNRRWSMGMNWGPGAPRRRTSTANWRQPVKWNHAGALCVDCNQPFMDSGVAVDCACGQIGAIGRTRRPRVFCASLADWLDDEVPVEWLADLLDLIRHTPGLDWLLLTKRPESWNQRLAAAYESRRGTMLAAWLKSWIDEGYQWVPENVWIGTTVEDQRRADERIPTLLDIPAKVRFLSCEPLLGPVDLSAFIGRAPDITGGRVDPYNFGIHWIIAGGESGPKARPMHPDWARSLRDQCAAAGVAFHFKQWGEWSPATVDYYAGEEPIEIPRRGVIQPSGAMVPMCADAFLHPPAPGSWWVARTGKKAAGRQLDGREWNDFPQTTP